MPLFSFPASRRAVILAALGATVFSPAASAGETVNVYSYRQPALVQPLFDAFTATTGIAVRVLFAENGLVERIAQEGQNSPADVLLTADAGRLVEAASRGIAAPVTSPAILTKIPANLRGGAACSAEDHGVEAVWVMRGFAESHRSSCDGRRHPP